MVFYFRKHKQAQLSDILSHSTQPLSRAAVRCWAEARQTTVIISSPQHLPFYCFIYKQGEVNWANRGGSQSGPSRCGVVPGSISTVKAASSILSLPLEISQGSLTCCSWALLQRQMDPGEQSGTRAGAPSVCVNLSSDHTHDFLLYLGVLSINVGIAHLPILVSAKDRASVSTRGAEYQTMSTSRSVSRCDHFIPKLQILSLLFRMKRSAQQFFSTQTPMICPFP